MKNILEPSRTEKRLESKSDDLDRKRSADAGIRTRVLTLARLSDNQLHYIHSANPQINFLNIYFAVAIFNPSHYYMYSKHTESRN